jgi:putative ABC transport system substrate-binding protein
VQSAAVELGLRLVGIEFREQPYDYERAAAPLPSDGRRVVIVLTSPVFAVPDRARLPDFALRHRLASMFSLREFVNVGGFMSYGASFTAMYRRAAEYVDRIARGVKPADLPIEQPTKFELVINLKTAKALDLAIPDKLLALADEVSARSLTLEPQKCQKPSSRDPRLARFVARNSIAASRESLAL